MDDKREEVKGLDLGLGIFLIVVGLIILLISMWGYAWKEGYNQGQRVAHAYYLATNSTPSQEWALDRAHWHYTEKYQILNSLVKPNPGW